MRTCYFCGGGGGGNGVVQIMAPANIEGKTAVRTINYVAITSVHTSSKDMKQIDTLQHGLCFFLLLVQVCTPIDVCMLCTHVRNEL